MRTDFWTNERIADLKRLWAEGQTAGEIAKKLGGISRSAVLGKIFRLRLDAAKESTTKSRRKAKCARQKSRRAPAKDRPTRRRGAEPEAAPRAPKRKSVFDLTNQCCRWPHGEVGTKNFFFCGAPGADVLNGLPYCPQHMRRAYIVPPEHSGTIRLATSFTPWRVVSKLRPKTAA